MASKEKPGVELDNAAQAPENNIDTEDEGESGMTRAKWLACLALGLSYTTAFQQGACLGAIVKSIDEALGVCLSASLHARLTSASPQRTTTG
jgi:hypothetical protein